MRIQSWLACTAALISLAASAAVTPLPGSSPQSVTPNSRFAPVRVLVTDANGRAVPGAYIYYNVGWYWSPFQVADKSRCASDLGDNCSNVADANGVAELQPLQAIYPGPGEITVFAGTKPWATDLGVTTVRLQVLTPDGVPFSKQNLWWGGLQENGWGMSVTQHGNALFNTLFAYDDQGEPTWYVQPDGKWTGQTFSGALYSPRSAPYFSYDASKLSVGSAVDATSISFYSRDSAYLDIALKHDEGGMRDASVRPILPLDFSPEVPRQSKGISDLWWGGPEQNGWGVSFMENGGNLFGVWFTYGADGKPIWFSLQAGEWVDGATYRGTIVRTRGTPWPVGYDASKLEVRGVGTFTLRIVDAARMTFDYSLDGHAGTLGLQRIDF